MGDTHYATDGMSHNHDMPSVQMFRGHSLTCRDWWKHCGLVDWCRPLWRNKTDLAIRCILDVIFWQEQTLLMIFLKWWNGRNVDMMSLHSAHLMGALFKHKCAWQIITESWRHHDLPADVGQSFQDTDICKRKTNLVAKTFSLTNHLWTRGHPKIHVHQGHLATSHTITWS